MGECFDSLQASLGLAAENGERLEDGAKGKNTPRQNITPVCFG